MPSKITMNKRVALGYGIIDEDQTYLGSRGGFKIYMDDSTDKNYVEIWVYDMDTSKRMRSAFDNVVTTRFKIVAHIELSKDKRHWHVDLTQVDSRYRGQKLAKRLYSFLLKKGYNLRAGDSQSPGGRYIWNELAKDRSIVIMARKSKHSKIMDFPKPGKCELVSDVFDLFDTDAEIYAVASLPSSSYRYYT